LFDLLLHAQPAKGVLPTLQAVRDEVAVLKAPPYSRTANTFGHIFAGGYAAGYYSYKWAEVLSADAFSRFEEEGVLSPVAGSAFRHEVLGRGGSRDAMTNFVAFRGRPPSVDALLRHNGMVAN
jgi:oligopeptidase A